MDGEIYDGMNVVLKGYSIQHYPCSHGLDRICMVVCNTCRIVPPELKYQNLVL